MKVEYNKLKTIFDNDILTKYEQSLKEANEQLKLAELEIERAQQQHQDQIEQVSSPSLTFVKVKSSLTEESDRRVDEIKKEMYKKDKLIFKATRKAK